MPKVSRNDDLLTHKELELAFLHRAIELDYALIDFEIIEKITYSDTRDAYFNTAASHHQWINNQDLFQLRSDWTHTIVQYQKKYPLNMTKLAYSGPIMTKSETIHQLGLEIFSRDLTAQQNLLMNGLDFLQEQIGQAITIVVLSHNKLLKKILSPDDYANPSVRRYIAERNHDQLATILGLDHTLIGLMKVPPHEQLTYLSIHFPDLQKHLDELSAWQTLLRNFGIPHVHIDALSLPTHSYYQGIFLNGYHSNELKPILSGGQYTAHEKAFGIAINSDIVTDLKRRHSNKEAK